MAALSKAFLSETERIHHDHEKILNELSELEMALQRLDFGPDILSDQRKVRKVQEVCQRLAGELPEHCRREEAMLYDTVSGVSTELAEFAKQMHLQHLEIIALLNAFCVTLDDLPNSFDLTAAVTAMRSQGLELIQAIRGHINCEEHTLSGFL